MSDNGARPADLDARDAGQRRRTDGERWPPAFSRFTGSARVFFVWRLDVGRASGSPDYRRIDGP